jgi:hypothetical protein
MRNKSCCQNINGTKIAQGVLAGVIILFMICMGISISGCGGGDGGSYNPVVPTSTCTPVNPTATSVPTVTKTPSVNPTATNIPINPTATPTSTTPTPTVVNFDPNNINTYPTPLPGNFSSKVKTTELEDGQEKVVGNKQFTFKNNSTGTVYTYTTNSNGVRDVQNLPIGTYEIDCPDLDDRRSANFPNRIIYITNFRGGLPD